MPMIEFSSDPSPHLTRALLIYESSAFHEADREIIVTQHEVKSGVIQPGDSLDLDAFRKLIEKGGGGPIKKDRGEWSWPFPRMLAENDTWRVWWSPSGMRSVFIGYDSAKPKVQHAWIPPLVWAAHRTAPSCYLFAYNGDTAPTPRTDVYRPAFGPRDEGLNHVHSDCRICVGNMKLDGHTPEAWERGFWNSRFKVPGNLKHTEPYGCEKVFKKIGPLESALSRCRSAH